MERYAKGTKVSWRWGAHTAQGRFARHLKHHVERTIKGTRVARHATEEEPAYMVEQEDGALVLRHHSELRKLA